jgi:anti-sigma factor (TIGR02949 family)
LSGTDCEHVLAQITLFLDGELAEGEGDRVRVHVAACDACRDRTDFHRHLKEVVRDACGTCEVPPDLLARVRALLAEPVD